MSGLAFSLGSKRPAEGPGRPGQVKKPAKVSDLFGADSDEEEPPVPQHVSAKQRGGGFMLLPAGACVRTRTLRVLN